MPDSWYIAINGTEVGPMTLQELKATLATFADAKDMLVWRDGLADWKPVRDLPELLFQAAPSPPLPPAPSVQREAMRSRSNALSDIRPNGRNAAIKEKAKQSIEATVARRRSSIKQIGYARKTAVNMRCRRLRRPPETPEPRSLRVRLKT